jgi:cation diffusion facilitator family transporter
MQKDYRQQVQRVFLITLLLNWLVAFGKIFVGLWSGALSITADGFHSLTDGSSNIVALIANRYADQPADNEHPYGHRRIETLAALGIGTLLLLTAFEVAQGALERLQTGASFEVTPLMFGVLIVTLAVNYFVNRYQVREGKRLKSELLLADAAHTGADVYVTLSVLASMVLIRLFGWVWVDTAVALVVVALIAREAFRILRRTGRVLVDTAPYTPEQLTDVLQSIPGEIVRARSRGTTDAAYIDIDVQVNPQMTAEETAALTSIIRQRLEQSIGNIAEVEVHFTPGEQCERDYNLVTRAHASALGLDAHTVRVSGNGHGKTLEIDVEVPPQQTLGEAHAQVSKLEQDLQNTLPEITEVITHIEPAAAESTTDEGQALVDKALALLLEQFPAVNWHHARIYTHGTGCVLTLHAAMPPELTVEAAHQLAEAAVTLLRAHFPALERVTIHTEPPE